MVNIGGIGNKLNPVDDVKNLVNEAKGVAQDVKTFAEKAKTDIVNAAEKAKKELADAAKKASVVLEWINKVKDFLKKFKGWIICVCCTLCLCSLLPFIMPLLRGASLLRSAAGAATSAVGLNAPPPVSAPVTPSLGGGGGALGSYGGSVGYGGGTYTIS